MADHNTPYLRYVVCPGLWFCVLHKLLVLDDGVRAWRAGLAGEHAANQVIIVGPLVPALLAWRCDFLLPIDHDQASESVAATDLCKESLFLDSMAP
jgi:hypothetical protein